MQTLGRIWVHPLHVLVSHGKSLGHFVKSHDFISCLMDFQETITKVVQAWPKQILEDVLNVLRNPLLEIGNRNLVDSHSW